MNQTTRLLLSGTILALFLLALLATTNGVWDKPAQASPVIETPATLATPAVQPSLAVSPTVTYTLYLPVLFSPPPSPKKGFDAHGSPACGDLVNLRASWYFNAGVSPDPACGSEYNANFVPMIYNGPAMANLATAVVNAQASGWLMGFSEPNLTEQGSYLSPADGAILWKQIEDAVAGTNIKLVSPAPNQWEDGQYGLPYGNRWTWYMVEEYKRLYGRKPRFDALGWHYYADSLGDLQAFLDARRVEALKRGYDVPFWITEFAGKCVTEPDSQIQAVMSSSVPWFNQTPWIGRYAWFATRLTPGSDAAGHDYSRCSLIDAQSGDITALGRMYRQY